MYVEGDTYTLIINNVYGADADEYSCRASNKGGSKSTRAELIIMSKIHIIFYKLVFLSGVRLGTSYDSPDKFSSDKVFDVMWTKFKHFVYERF